MRNLLARVPKSAQAMVAATVRTIFDQPDRAAAEAQLLQVVEALGERFPAVTHLLLEAEGEILTFYDFPPEHRRQISSTNPLERLNKELKRRSAVVGIFPNRAALLRLFGALLAEQNDEWLVAGHRYMSEMSMRKLCIQGEEEMPAHLEAKTPNKSRKPRWLFHHLTGRYLALPGAVHPFQ
jgi:putative transposase